MTNEQLKEAIAIEATRRWKERGVHFIETLANIAVELTQEGWTPPVAVDPDIAETREIVARIYDVSWPERANSIRKGDQDHNVENISTLAGIKRGRALAAEAKPGMVWVKHDGSEKCPVALSALFVAKFVPGLSTKLFVGSGEWRDWSGITHYAIITPPTEDVA